MLFNKLFKTKEKMYQSIDCNELGEHVKANKNAVILDVRTPSEFKTGAIPNAKNIDFYSRDFAAQIEKLDKNKTYYVYCQAGSRSAKACETMANKGFSKLYNLYGGISYWKGVKE